MKRQKIAVGNRGKLKKMKRQKKSEREIKDDGIDRLSDLPDHVLLHIMEFMNIKLAFQTCLCSKRWKDLWKSLTNLTLHDCYSGQSDIFIKFVSQILSCRDASIPLHNLDFMFVDLVDLCKTTLLKVMKYAAASHNLQQLAIDVELRDICDLELPPSIFYCRSLTYLKLSFRNLFRPTRIKFPKSFNLPALKSLHLDYLTFTTSDNGYVEPFSTCNMLNTLVIENCYLQDDAQTLHIANSKVTSLTIGFYLLEKGHNYKVVLCTPKLTSLTTAGRPTFQAPSACNLPLLEEIMSLSLKILAEVLRVLSNTGSMRTQPPCFVRLESLKVVRLRTDSKTSDERVSEMVKYLLQNSPPARVDIIRQPELNTWDYVHAKLGRLIPRAG